MLLFKINPFFLLLNSSVLREAYKYSSGFDFKLNVIERKIEFLRTEIEYCGDDFSTYEELNVTLSSQIPELNINI